MITCRQLAELLFDFAAGQLKPEHQKHVEEHLGLCSSCVAYLEGYRLTLQMTRHLRRPSLPPDLARRLRVLLEQSERSQSALDQDRTPPTEPAP
jgi:predicted anti-sigma-YlaC factor YlaD